MNSVHNIQLGINIDDDAIRQGIIAQASSEMSKVLMDAYYEKGYYYGGLKSKSALDDMVKGLASDFVAQYKDDIIDRVVRSITDKLIRSKGFKETIIEKVGADDDARCD